VFEGCLIAEEVAAGCTGIGTAMEATPCRGARDRRGQRGPEEEIPGADDQGVKFAAYGDRAGRRSDVAGIKTVARRVGSDYVLNGAKMWITNGSVADWYFVLVYTDPEKKHRGMSAFIVDRSTARHRSRKKEWNMGQHASDTRALTFTDVKVPGSNLLGKEGDGFKIAMTAFDHTRPIVSAAAVGLARCAIGAFDPLRAGAPEFRRADCLPSSRLVHDRGDGDEHRGGEAARVAIAPARSTGASATRGRRRWPRRSPRTWR